ncbi:MAG: ABC transporter permease [Chitinophagaceae bacterium]|nr:ABC transporter permease [Chitinophagaceae bacterium]
MNKIFVIIQREYLTRVKNKTFIISTFLLPIVMVLFIFGSTYFAIKSREKQKIAVVNDPGFFKKFMKSDPKSIIFEFTEGVDSLNYESKGYNGILYLPTSTGNNNYELRSNKQFGIEANEYVEKQINKAVENNLLQLRGIDINTIDSIAKANDNAATLNNVISDGKGKTNESNAGVAYGVGYGSGILIYITMFIFGAMVMRGVAEEKINRIAEVIVSSCKPFELMFGKIIGIAAVGLTQFILWIVFIFVIISSIQFFLPSEMIQQVQETQQVRQQVPGGSSAAMITKIMEAKKTLVNGVNWPLIIVCFLFYFLGGYLFYAALFAAIGSVINEDPQEAQSLMLPITMPIIFAFIILNSSLQNPNSPIAVWASIIPFTSPIVMMGRIPFGVPGTVPIWQLALSMVTLVGGFLFTTWFAGKIYRTGILMNGKKITWKEMIRWVVRGK